MLNECPDCGHYNAPHSLACVKCDAKLGSVSQNPITRPASCNPCHGNYSTRIMHWMDQGYALADHLRIEFPDVKPGWILDMRREVSDLIARHSDKADANGRPLSPAEAYRQHQTRDGVYAMNQEVERSLRAYIAEHDLVKCQGETSKEFMRRCFAVLRRPRTGRPGPLAKLLPHGTDGFEREPGCDDELGEFS